MKRAHLVWGLLLAACSDAAAPHVVRFSAAHGEVYAGETVAIDWEVAGADAVEIRLGELVIGSGTSGQLLSPPLNETGRFLLRAVREAQSTERELLVQVRLSPLPTISLFRAAPLWLLEPGPVTVGWSTRLGAKLTLEQNGSQVADLTGQSSGEITLTAAGGDELVLVASTGASTLRSEPLVIAAAVREIESNDDEVRAQPINQPVIGTAGPGDADVYSFHLGAGAFPQVQLSGLDGRCEFPLFIELLLSAGGLTTVLASSDALDGCPHVDADRVSRSWGGLSEGQIFVRVSSTEARPYALRARAVPPLCGNRRVESVAGEGCDDGNAIDGDGCSACRPDGAIDEVEPNPRTAPQLVGASGILLGVREGGGEDAFQVHVAAGEWVVAEVSRDGKGVCNGGSGPFASISLPVGALPYSFDGSRACGRSTLAPIAQDRDLLIRVIGGGGPYQLEWRVGLPSCGNGAREGTEECDAEMGCAPDCRIVRPAQGSPLPLILSAGEISAVPLTVTATAHVSAQLAPVDMPGCASSRPRLELRRADGSLVLGDEDSGTDLCPELDPRRAPALRALPAGSYLLVIANREGTLTTFVQTQIEAPRCGDGVVDPTEACDDGNSSSGDGCDDGCRLDTISTLAPPIDQQFTLPGMGASRTFQIDVVDPGSVIRVQTSSPLGSCFADTETRVLDQAQSILAISSVPSCSVVIGIGQVPGPHLINVRSLWPRAGYHQAHITLGPPACGDGILSLPVERCDDRDATANDGCSTCQPDPSVTLELEPNNSAGRAFAVATSSVGGNVIVAGRFDAGDQDWIRLDASLLPGPFHLSARIYQDLGSLNSCPGDTLLGLYDAGGTLLAENDDRAQGAFCSLIDTQTGSGGRMTRLDPGVYLLDARAFGVANVLPFYLLGIQVVP